MIQRYPYFAFKSCARRPFSSSSVVLPPRKLLIGGKWVNALSGKEFDTINPATEEKITSVQEADAQDADRAVRAAREAFDNGPWPRMSAVERAKVMWRLS